MRTSPRYLSSFAPFAPVASLAVAGSVFFTTGCGAVVRPDGGKGLLPVGALAPDVTGFDIHHTAVTLSRLRGQLAVVYFYPIDGSPGCTTEACAFRDAWTKYVDAHVAVIGVSTGSTDDHQHFLEEKKLPFALASDPNRDIAVAYGVGKSIVGDQRITFLVDANGRIAKVWPNVDPGIHADEVLTAAKALPTTK